ncbi:MAG: hypothetical protein JWM32_2748 [Verrucomicrobia bacterium]|nr:hypothetical protein [Verrucomicrobiota bacterium]
MKRALLVFGTTLIALVVSTNASARKVEKGVTQEVKLNGGRGPGGQMAVGDFQVQHIDGFKGAHRVAISVFNVAFPDENSLTSSLRAKNRTSTSTGYYTTVTTTTSFHKSSTLHTTMTGLDHATQQRIADAAYADFVEELKKAGYEVVSVEELARLTPEFTTWASIPNFSKGRYGTYVAPTGRALRFLQGDAAKRDVSSKSAELFMPFRAWDRPQALTRSPYLAYDGKLGILAVTMVVDYGVYSTTGATRKLKEEVKVEFDKGVTAQSGTLYDTATLVEYWGPKSGGFPAIAALAVPVTSEKPFGELTGDDGVYTVKTDPVKFEQAALEVVHGVDAKLVAAIAAGR